MDGTLRLQFHFKNTTNCALFAPNQFTKIKCKDCSYRIEDHRSEAVADEYVLIAISDAQGKDGANIILESSDDNGELHLGGYTSCTTKYVKDKKITHVINAARGLEGFFVGWGKQIPNVEALGVKFLRLDWDDSETQIIWRQSRWDQLEEAILFIESARKTKGNVVVHCAQGKSRSATVVVAYIMAKQGLDTEQALKVVKAKRSIAEPNNNFMYQLKQFESSPELERLRKEMTNCKISCTMEV